MISAVIELVDGTVLVHSQAVSSVGTIFKKGFYEAKTDGSGNIHIKIQPIGELHQPFESETNEEILNTVDEFFKPEIRETINKLGYIHKLGILLHGIAGTGKTSLLTYIANQLVEKYNAIVFFCNDGNTLGTAMGLASQAREIQDNPIIFIGDEFERFANSAESEMKNFLDGKDSVENTLFLASTNYIEKVPDTLKKRPSRFRLVVEIKGIESKEAMFKATKIISDKISPSLFTDEEIIALYEDKSSVTLDEIKHECLTKVTNTFVKIKPEKQQIGFTTNKKKSIVLDWVDSAEELGVEDSEGEIKATGFLSGISIGSQSAKKASESVKKKFK